ncbi:S-adenosyl methyltransferase [Pseudonocardia ammonioxydans]|uniref:S-adenosyl methyltransferase n=1 Tax=Pseudonocardia ammonioxydans TaxID=260086 RepID=A0A1I4XPR0_PSUAM|nr:SAM-dependent methyltransferase [Pseudonocardia ammonioxydans]SFN27827.1 S-adenosyl methyltransferase [Pseudonocardia ammonioxydans]
MADPHGAEAVPNLARMYDYYLGGSHNFAVDRAAADRALRTVPHARTFALANRAFLGRVVRALVADGIDQFLDLGSGVPTVGNVHEIAQAADPAARVAYVDIEPVAVGVAGQVLADNPNATITHADIRDPAAVLAAPGVADLLDLDRPVAVLAIAILHALPDADDPAGILAAYRDACAPGSHLAVSHLAATSFSADQQKVVREVLDETPTPVTLRTREQLTEMLAGYEILEPGVCLLPAWRPDDTGTTAADDADSNGYGALARLSAR